MHKSDFFVQFPRHLRQRRSPREIGEISHEFQFVMLKAKNATIWDRSDAKF